MYCMYTACTAINLQPHSHSRTAHAHECALYKYADTLESKQLDNIHTYSYRVKLALMTENRDLVS